MIIEHTVSVGGREFTSFALTLAEADAMIAQGFRFKIYDVGNGWFQLEEPFAQSGNADAGRWTFRQEALPSTIEITAQVIRDLLPIVEVAMPKQLREQDVRIMRARELLKALEDHGGRTG